MAVSILCIGCSTKLKVPDSKVGVPSPCPRCGTVFLVEWVGDGKVSVRIVATSSTLVYAPPPVSLPPPPPPVPPIYVEVPEPEEELPRFEKQQPPFLVENEAIIECPWCNKRLRVGDYDFNVKLYCKRCDGAFKVAVREDRKIPFRCQNCLEPMLIGAHKAGQPVVCVQPDCQFFPVWVPQSEVTVHKIGRHPDEIEAERRRLREYRPPPPPPVNPGACPGCGIRYPRNPTGLCYKCRGR